MPPSFSTGTSVNVTAMLFNSVPFIFGFLPVVIILVWLSERTASSEVTLGVLVLASLFFYGWWNPAFLPLLVISVIVNYFFGLALGRWRTRMILTISIVFNLALIAYFKYAEFLVSSFNDLLSMTVQIDPIALPLAISFFTFQQIAYQVDVFRNKVKDRSFLRYSLFVTFFPQLIAGPIVHHQEIIPQMIGRARRTLTWENLIVGGMIFFIGLYKKVIIADGFAPFADSLFDNALQAPTLLEAWGGTLAYTLQLYFDFSGYSDMAIGLARMFGVRLPVNFNSPYKARSIIEFWQNWHITLSRFLRDYLYIPLGGNRRGGSRRYLNVMITMLLGGLWHGAGWTFVAWGALHGAFLAINHLWRHMSGYTPETAKAAPRIQKFAGWALTFIAVTSGWVLFRAESWGDAVAIYQAMIGINGVGVDIAESQLLNPQLYSWLVVVLLVVWLAPNTQELFSKWSPAIGFEPRKSLDKNPVWQLRGYWLMPFVITGIATSLVVVLSVQSGTKDFIYMVF